MRTSEPSKESRTDLEISVCANGVVNVHRLESDRAHSVMLDVLGDGARCSCKGYHFRGYCSHADGVEERPLVVSTALAAAASYHEPRDEPEPSTDVSGERAVAADGGEETETCKHGVEGCPGPIPDDPEHPCASGHCDDCRPEYFEHLYGEETDGGHVEDEQRPAITHHVEPEHVGGERYRRCEGCGSETLESAEGILHDDECPRADGQPEERPDACRCRHILAGDDPCEACERAGFETITLADVSVHDGGNREVGRR